MSKSNTKTDFLSLTKSIPKEIPLVIYKDENDFPTYSDFLIQEGFQKLDYSSELLSAIKDGKKIFVKLSENNQKNLYDIIAQYPSGQISITDPKTRKSVQVDPDYENTKILLFATSDVLLSAEKNGLNFRNITGLTYQK
jgi:hypothetical protein